MSPTKDRSKDASDHAAEVAKDHAAEVAKYSADLIEPTETSHLPVEMPDDIESRRTFLLVYHTNGTELISLSPDRPVIIGRLHASDVVIRDGLLSKRHALFELVDDEVWVEDLHSTNGTWIKNKRVTRARVEIDDIVSMGATRVAVHLAATRPGQLHGLEDHDRFYAHLSDEVSRAQTFGRKLALLMVRAAPGHDNLLPRWSPRVREQLRQVDRIGLYAPEVVEILLSESGLRQASELAEIIVKGQGAEDPPLLCGIAVYPEAGKSADALLDVCRASLKQASIEQPVVALGAGDAPSPVMLGKDGLLVQSPAMLKIDEMIDRIATSTIPVLILGETGAGKEVIARAIHARSNRRDKPMRTINCGSIPETLIESVMFGHEKGAFTGADRLSLGVFEEAEGGSVLLDEIGELSLRAQVALLRALDTRKVTRVGASKEIAVDVRILAATHKNLQAMCKAGSFRSDLFFRLNTMVIRIPPLRERVEEIPLLAEHFCRLACEANDCPPKRLDEDALELLSCYYWPGNVRELRNAVERAVVIIQGDTITADDLPARVQKPSMLSMPVRRPPRRGLTQTIKVDKEALAEDLEEFRRTRADQARAEGQAQADQARAEGQTRADETQPDLVDFKTQVQSYEVKLIRDALIQSKGNQTKAAQLLQMARRTLINKIEVYGVDRHGLDESESRDEQAEPIGDLDFKTLVERYETRLLKQAMDRCGGNPTKAAQLLRMPKYTLSGKLSKYGLK